MSEPNNPVDRRMAIERVLAEAAGSAYVAEVGARQSAALLRSIGRGFVDAQSVAAMVSQAREHELMTMLDFVRGIPGRGASREIDATAVFAGERLAVIRADRDVGADQSP